MLFVCTLSKSEVIEMVRFENGSHEFMGISASHALRNETAIEQHSLWGIKSWWTLSKVSKNVWKLEIGGHRNSLADWCPLAILKMADRKWRRKEFVVYESWRTDRSPAEYGFMRCVDRPTAIYDMREPDDPEDEFEDAPKRGKRYGSRYTSGAYGRNY